MISKNQQILIFWDGGSIILVMACDVSAHWSCALRALRTCIRSETSALFVYHFYPQRHLKKTWPAGVRPLKASSPLIRVLVINDNGLWINDFSWDNEYRLIHGWKRFGWFLESTSTWIWGDRQVIDTTG